MTFYSIKKRQSPFLPVYLFEKDRSDFHLKLILCRFYKNGIEVRKRRGTIFYRLPAHPRNFLRGNILNLYLEGTMLFPFEDPEIYGDPQFTKRYQENKTAELDRLLFEITTFQHFLDEIQKAKTEEEFNLALEWYMATGKKFTPLIEEIEKQIYHIRAGHSNWIIREVKVGPQNAKKIVKVAVDTGANIGLMTPQAVTQSGAIKTGKFATIKGVGNALLRLETVYLDLEYEGVTVRCLMAIDPNTIRIATVPIMVPVTVYFDFQEKHVRFI